MKQIGKLKSGLLEGEEREESVIIKAFSTHTVQDAHGGGEWMF